MDRFVSRRMVWLLGLSLWSGLFFGGISEAARSVSVNPAVSGMPLGLHLDYLEDPEGVWSLDDVRNPVQARRFVQSTEINPNFGMQRSVYWTRIYLNMEKRYQDERWIVETEMPLLDRLDVFFVKNDQLVVHKPLGLLFPPSEQDLVTGNVSFLIPENLNGNFVIYLRYETKETLLLGLRLWDAKDLLGKTFRSTLLYGLALGILLALVFYNLLLYFSLRDRTYIYYLLFLTAFFLYWMVIDGFVHPFLWLSPVTGMNRLPLLLSTSTLILGLAFSRRFLNTSEILPRHDRFLKAKTVLAVAFLALIPFDYFLASHLIAIVAFFSIFGLGTAALFAWRQGYRPARYYLLAWTFMLSSSAVFLLMLVGLFPANVLTRNALLFGLDLGGVLLSFALADRIRNITEDYKSKLEHTVRARTTDLQATVFRLHSEIANRKKVEEELRISEKWFRTAFNTSPDSIVVSRQEDGMILDINKGFTRLTGFSRKEAIGKTSKELELWVDPKDRERMLDEFRRNGLITNLEITFNSVNGPVLCLLSGCPMEVDGRTNLLIFIRDITEWMHAQNMLKEVEQKYELILEHANVIVWTYDMKASHFLFASSALTTILGYTEEEAKTQCLEDVLTPASLQAAGKELLHLMDNWPETSRFHLEAEHIHKDGSRIWLEVSGSRLMDGNEDSFLISGVSRDISERKQAEFKQRALEDQLRQSQKMEAIGRLAGGVAHDFNNILTGINGNLALARMEIDSEDSAQELLQEVERASSRAANLTRQLLAFSRKQFFTLRALNLNDLVEDLKKMLAPILGETVRLETRLTEDPWEIRADAGQIEQVLVNLAVNARDAMPTGGTLRIETENRRVDEQISEKSESLNPGDYIVIRVIDTGSGIDEETRLRIFEPFFTTKSKGKGTGLGLAMVYGIIEQHGGHIEVISEIGRGTEFRVLLPRSQEKRQDSPVESLNLGDWPTGTETILFVEDERLVREIAIRTLHRLGYHVIEAAHGEEALERGREFQGDIHILVTDIVMPGMNGRELADEIVADRPGIKILFTSGYTDDIILRHGVRNREVNFLPKPYSPEIIARKVREILDDSSTPSMVAGKRG